MVENGRYPVRRFVLFLNDCRVAGVLVEAARTVATSTADVVAAATAIPAAAAALATATDAATVGASY